MDYAAWAIGGFFSGGVFGFIGYWCVFIFTNVLDGFAEKLDIEESYIFFATLFTCAISGSILFICVAFIRARMRKSKNHAINGTAN